EAEVGSTPATGSHAAPTDEDTNFHNETTFESTTNPPTESNTPPRYAWMANLERPQGNFPTNGNVEKRSNNSTDVSDDLSQCISKLVSCRGEYLDAQQDLDRVLQRFIEQYAELKTDLVRTQDLFVGSERELTQKRTEVESMNNELSDCREKLAILDDVKRRLSAL
ncbi:MAG TPA: hypothetical protein VI565_02910, partial [Burkholderiales bacterium]|nr:hypothetical protein [Burkholderiales bacterium]